jgi:phage shock protein PspC (stress-responsive transcriptional regulator)
MSHPQTPPSTTPRRLTRSDSDVWLSGVCGGIGEYTGVDPNLVRLLVAAGALVSFGTLFVAYVVAWILMPQQ